MYIAKDRCNTGFFIGEKVLLPKRLRPKSDQAGNVVGFGNTYTNPDCVRVNIPGTKTYYTVHKDELVKL